MRTGQSIRRRPFPTSHQYWGQLSAVAIQWRRNVLPHPGPLPKEREKQSQRCDLLPDYWPTLEGRKRFPLPEGEGQGENAPTVVALCTLEPERAHVPDLPPRAGTRRDASISIRATPAPPSPLNGERAGVRGETTETRRSVHGELSFH
jgi:hypothetical protein